MDDSDSATHNEGHMTRFSHQLSGQVYISSWLIKKELKGQNGSNGHGLVIAYS